MDTSAPPAIQFITSEDIDSFSLPADTEPTSSTTYRDETAGKSSRRYYIVAVDVLGQEGFPSAPVWFEREWKQHYEPFIGEWHQ